MLQRLVVLRFVISVQLIDNYTSESVHDSKEAKKIKRAWRHTLNLQLIKSDKR